MPRIVYVTFPATAIAGGIKITFRHVELLVAAGFDAVVATQDGLAPDWFDTSAPMVPLEAIQSNDVLVLPENAHHLLSAYARSPNPKVVFCQSWAMVHQGLGPMNSYSELGVRHLLYSNAVVMEFCRRRFPELELSHVPYSIDTDLFRPAPVKRLQIACSPRKRPLEAAVIRDMFRAWYPEYASVPWRVLDRATESQATALFGESALFLALGRFEANAMTPLEAMAAGCIVAGFGGLAGPHESLTPANGFWAAEDDLFGATDRLALAVRTVVERGAVYDQLRACGLETARGYSKATTSRRLQETWTRLLPQLGV